LFIATRHSPPVATKVEGEGEGEGDGGTIENKLIVQKSPKIKLVD